MSCRRCEARLAPLVDGELRRRERDAVLRHVAGCPTCASLLDELRCVDALLLQPNEVRLRPDFTGATMAAVRGLPRPAACRAPIAAFLVCYLVGSWLFVAAALALAPLILGSIATAVLHAVRTVADALGGFGHMSARLAGWALAGDAGLAIAFLAVAHRARPGLVKRLRW